MRYVRLVLGIRAGLIDKFCEGGLIEVSKLTVRMFFPGRGLIPNGVGYFLDVWINLFVVFALHISTVITGNVSCRILGSKKTVRLIG